MKVWQLCGLAMHRGHTTHAGGDGRAAVITVFATDDHFLFRLTLKRPEMANHPNNRVIGLRTGIGKENMVDAIRGNGGKAAR